MAISSSASGLRPGVCTSTTRPTAPYNGQLIYETDTKKVYIYNGTSWVEQPTAGMVDAKGDLLVGTAADTAARLAVGADGHALIADSAATNGLSYHQMNAWRNTIINGDFSVNQRAFTSATTTATFGHDRWRVLLSGGTVTYSTQAFTLGNAISGQEPANFARIVTSGQSAAGNYAILNHPIEGVRTFAGQTVTVSFWAKAGSGTPKIALELTQDFGTGGSPSAAVQTYGGQVTISTSWVRYQISVAIPSISGKTIGTAGNDQLAFYLWVSGGTDFNSRTGSLGIQNGTFDIWGVQMEAGSVATPFERRPQQIELALCQRYYQRRNSNLNYIVYGATYSTTLALAFWQPNVPFRAAPSGTADSNTLVWEEGNGTAITVTSVSVNQGGSDGLTLNVSFASGGTSLRPGAVRGTGAGSYIGLSAELP